MELVLKRSRVVEMWEERVASAGARFAEVLTDTAHYDRVAIVNLNERNITVEYPKVHREDDKIRCTIARDIIPMKNVERIQWYLG